MLARFSRSVNGSRPQLARAFAGKDDQTIVEKIQEKVGQGIEKVGPRTAGTDVLFDGCITCSALTVACHAQCRSARPSSQTVPWVRFVLRCHIMTYASCSWASSMRTV